MPGAKPHPDLGRRATGRSPRPRPRSWFPRLPGLAYAAGLLAAALSAAGAATLLLPGLCLAAAAHPAAAALPAAHLAASAQSAAAHLAASAPAHLAAGRPAPATPLNTGDEAWVLASSALVLVMTPGLALFYGGMVRKKNVITTMLQVFVVVGVVSLQWVLFGYSLAFGPDVHHLIGSLAWVGMRHVGAAPDAQYAPAIPSALYAIFQMMFAVITPALIVGGLAERMKFKAFVLFIALWATFVYDPLAHWVWGHGGWLNQLGVLDFAGGTVVHISSGVAGLVVAIMLGRRQGLGGEHIRAHNVPMVLIGTALLWFGWFGFNAGSALGATPLATSAFLVTNTAAAVASIAWLAVEWLRTGKPTLMGACAGAICGLVAITPASGFVDVTGSIAIGAGAGVVCYLAAALLKNRLGYDDALDAFGGHGIGGTFGALATGLFATTAINGAGANGLLYGNPRQFLLQLVGVAAAWAFSAAGTYVIFKLTDLAVGCRVSPEEEAAGLDAALHGEDAYPEQLSLGDVLGGFAPKSSPSLGGIGPDAANLRTIPPSEVRTCHRPYPRRAFPPPSGSAR